MIPQNTKTNDPSTITAQRGASSYFPIAISLTITSYGFYAFLTTILSNEWALYGTVLFLAILILFIEDHRTEELRGYLNSLLKMRLDKALKPRYFSLLIASIITALFIALDMFGAYQISDKIERMLIEGIATNSKTYKILEERAKSGADAKRAYNKELKLYNTAKDKHYNECNQAWRLPTYRTKNTNCKNQFKQTPPKLGKASSSINPNDYKAIESEVAQKVAGYKDLFFYVFFGFSMLLNYFAVSPIISRYRVKAYNLTPDVVAELQQREQRIKAKELEKLQESTNLQENKAGEKNALEVALEGILYDIELSKEQRTIESMQKIPLAITNNSYQTPMRGGFVGGKDNILNPSVKPNGYNQSEESEGQKVDLAKDSNQSVKPNGYNQTVNNEIDFISLHLFDREEHELIRILWSNTHKTGDNLTTRKEVLAIIGDTKHNTIKLRDLYKKLLEHNYIYKRVGYFANALAGMPSHPEVKKG